MRSRQQPRSTGYGENAHAHGLVPHSRSSLGRAAPALPLGQAVHRCPKRAAAPDGCPEVPAASGALSCSNCQPRLRRSTAGATAAPRAAPPTICSTTNALIVSMMRKSGADDRIWLHRLNSMQGISRLKETCACWWVVGWQGLGGWQGCTAVNSNPTPTSTHKLKTHATHLGQHGCCVGWDLLGAQQPADQAADEGELERRADRGTCRQ